MKSLFSSVQSLSHIQLCATLWIATCQASLFITNSQSLLKLMPIDSVMPSNHLILCSTSPPTFNLSLHQGLSQWLSSSHQVAKLLELQLQHQSFQWVFHFLAITHKANLNIHVPECAWMWFHFSWANWVPCLCHMVFIISGGKINLVSIILSWPEACLSAFQSTCF